MTQSQGFFVLMYLQALLGTQAHGFWAWVCVGTTALWAIAGLLTAASELSETP